MIDWGYEIMGWSGSACILIAYALLASRKLSGEHLAYHLINIAGATLLGTYGLIKDASAMVFLNGAWLFIGFFAIYNIYRRHKRIEG
jgi:hypothetical protein